MHKLTVIKIDESNEYLWERLAGESAQGGEFLRSNILKKLADGEIPRARLVRLGVPSEDGQSLLAGWALLIRRRWRIRYNSNFPLFYSGPCFAPPLDRKGDRSLHSKRLDILNILARAVKNEIDTCQCELPPDFPDVRGCIFAGFCVKLTACHIWEPSENSCKDRPNRTKRNEANRVRREGYTFDWLPMTESSIAVFNRLHGYTLAKLSWKAPELWCNALASHTFETGKAGICRLFGAFSPGEQADPEAVVSVLFNSARKTAYLWRMGASSNKPGLVPALYAAAGDAILAETGPGWSINFGGSPLIRLSRFKDYLGAEPVFHCQLEWQRPGWPWIVWTFGYALKKRIDRYRHNLIKRFRRNADQSADF